MKLAYLIPEFPGQTHIWMWREIQQLRALGVSIDIISTRPPLPRDRAKHDFADERTSGVQYLYDWRHKPSALRLLVCDTLLTTAKHPVRLAICLWMAARMAQLHPAALSRMLMLVPLSCRLARILARRRSEHLHLHSFGNSSLLAIFCRRLTGIPFSQTLNADIGIWGGFNVAKLQEAEFTIAITNELMRQIHAAAPQLPGDKYLLGRIGVDTGNWVPLEWHLPLPGTPFRILTVGRLHPSKGHDDLIRATTSLIGDGVDVTLSILGDGPQRAELEALAAQLGVADRVTFFGSVGESQIKREMAVSHCFVGASHAEPLGVVFMEAMAAGLPTIGTAAGGLPEIIDHGRSGLLVQPHDPQAIKQAIRDVMQDETLGKVLSQNGREKICRCFDSRLGAMTLLDRIKRDQAK